MHTVNRICIYMSAYICVYESNHGINRYHVIISRISVNRFDFTELYLTNACGMPSMLSRCSLVIGKHPALMKYLSNIPVS